MISVELLSTAAHSSSATVAAVAVARRRRLQPVGRGSGASAADNAARRRRLQPLACMHVCMHTAGSSHTEIVLRSPNKQYTHRWLKPTRATREYKICLSSSLFMSTDAVLGKHEKTYASVALDESRVHCGAMIKENNGFNSMASTRRPPKL